MQGPCPVSRPVALSLALSGRKPTPRCGPAPGSTLVSAYGKAAPSVRKSKSGLGSQFQTEQGACDARAIFNSIQQICAARQSSASLA